MNIGHRTLYQNFMSVEKVAIKKKGRSAVFLDKRSVLLSYRYYYYVYHLRKTYQDTLELLVDEFFISDVVIIRCLTNSQLQLKEIFASKITPVELKKLYPWYVWS